MDKNLLEFYILLYASRNETFLLKIEEYLFTGANKSNIKNPKLYFSEISYQLFFNVLCVIRNKIGKLPSLIDVEFVVSNLIKDNEDKKNGIIDLARDIYKSEEAIDFVLIEEEVHNFIKQVKFAEAFNSSMKDIQGQNYESAIEKMSKATQINFDSDLGLSIKDWSKVKTLLTETSSSDNVIATGYSFLDDVRILNGGIRGGEIGCVAAIPGLGKTLFLGNLAINAFLNGKKVLVVSFETSDSRLTSRFLSNLLNMDVKDVSRGFVSDDDTVEDIHKRDVASQSGDLRIKEFPAKVVSTNDIMAFLLDLKKYEDFEPDLILLDYLLIMTTNDKKMDASNTYLKYKTVSEEVRNLAKHLKIPIWTATQIGREGQAEGGGSKAITTSREMSESRGIYDTVDLFLTLNATQNQKKKQEISVFIDKNRNGESGKLVPLIVDYGHMSIKERV